MRTYSLTGGERPVAAAGNACGPKTDRKASKSISKLVTESIHTVIASWSVNWGQRGVVRGEVDS